MKRWEYLQAEYVLGIYAEGVPVDKLNELGAAGWEVTAIFLIEPIPYVRLGRYVVTLKREAPNAGERLPARDFEDSDLPNLA